ncbi:hypothetical protein E4U13_000232 [Claviceps humidiphila]|uniref:Uncharacterized protein n=1 Tax=Claviceps humidiphila TaxID=1294629 RepID=A0A9P7Q5A9_9HYPO|nr:hypothetical protein E4U13_000232 [Claviceps humidiphila]
MELKAHEASSLGRADMKNIARSLLEKEPVGKNRTGCFTSDLLEVRVRVSLHIYDYASEDITYKKVSSS